MHTKFGREVNTLNNIQESSIGYTVVSKSPESAPRGAISVNKRDTFPSGNKYLTISTNAPGFPGWLPGGSC